LWNAEADEFIPAGEQIRVVEADNLKLKVQRIDAR
jgi:membrane protein implicated in regulation of membrane protease activity